MNVANIKVNQNNVAVHLIGTDHKLIPSLLSALRHNKLTLTALRASIERIELFSAEAILYGDNGTKARIPIF
jgi:hypothetical protein